MSYTNDYKKEVAVEVIDLKRHHNAVALKHDLEPNLVMEWAITYKNNPNCFDTTTKIINLKNSSSKIEKTKTHQETIDDKVAKIIQESALKEAKITPKTDEEKPNLTLALLEDHRNRSTKKTSTKAKKSPNSAKKPSEVAKNIKIPPNFKNQINYINLVNIVDGKILEVDTRRLVAMNDEILPASGKSKVRNLCINCKVFNKCQKVLDQAKGPISIIYYTFINDGYSYKNKVNFHDKREYQRCVILDCLNYISLENVVPDYSFYHNAEELVLKKDSSIKYKENIIIGTSDDNLIRTLLEFSKNHLCRDCEVNTFMSCPKVKYKNQKIEELDFITDGCTIIRQGSAGSMYAYRDDFLVGGCKRYKR